MAKKKYDVVLLFDGVCNLCNGWVNFVIDHDPEGRIRFAPLQSVSGHRLLAEHEMDSEKQDTVILLDNGEVYERSDALLRLVGYLKGSARLLRAGVIIPRFIRNALYDMVAGKRYDWFGKRKKCRIPEPEIRDRFLEMSDEI